MNTQVKILNIWLTLVCLSAWVNSSNAQELELANGPIYLGTSVDANVFFELDDSGSMDWETLTEEYDYYLNYWRNEDEAKITSGIWRGFAGVGGHHTGRRDYVYLYHENDSLYYFDAWAANAEENPESLQRDWRPLSSDFNLLYYNPETTYQPWVGLPDASFSAARSDPQSGTSGYSSTRNLSGFTFNIWQDDHGYSGSRPDGPGDATDTPNGIVDLWDSRTSYTIWSNDWQTDSFTTLPAAGMAALNTDCTLASVQGWNAGSGWIAPFNDCFGTISSFTPFNNSAVNPWGRLLSQEQQNIANWYQYYRKRSYVAKAAISRVMASSSDFRYGLSVINNSHSLFVEVPSSGTLDYTSHNASLLQNLYSYNWGAYGTPLRQGLELAGKYLDDNLSGKTDPIISECQQNFSILLTDGYWNGNNPSSSIGNADGDGHSRTVADVAKYYYNKDLSPYPNSVTTSLIDDNSQQHMVTFTVAFGVEGELVDTDNDNNPNPELDEDDDWGNPFGSNSAKIDDLWHAAYNSKGEYVAAQTPSEVVNSLNDALTAITDRVSSAASVATNSSSLQAGSLLYQARFNSGDWSGELRAFEIYSDGSVNSTPAWEASSSLDSKNFNTDRAIITYNPEIDLDADGDADGSGIPFRFPSDHISPDILSDFNLGQIDSILASAPFPGTSNVTEIAINQQYGDKLVDFLRGDRSNEGGGLYNFRARGSVFGDVIDSSPIFVSAPRQRYPESIETSVSYLDFRLEYQARPDMVYVGANDGMLHGFDAYTGDESFAYVPNSSFSKLPNLADTEYFHRNFVNGKTIVTDAFLDDVWNPDTTMNGIWATVLVGSMGNGGQAIYALNITDPSTFSEANADDIVLWEFSDSDDDNMGYSYGTPSITKMANGQWVAVFGNGYNSTESDGNAGDGRSALYIVDLDTGALVKKIKTNEGSYTNQNGLSSPIAIDVNDDYMTDYIYAGDLLGNMWKFDVSSDDVDDWDIAIYDSGTPKPLFDAGVNQPITTKPLVTRHPDNYDGYMVYFGTGKYLEQNDNNSTGAYDQAFYGIWDKNNDATTSVSKSSLLQQSITNQISFAFDTDDDGDDDLFRVGRSISDYEINFNSPDYHQGWWMNLRPNMINGSANTNNFGERQVADADVRDGRIIFTTVIPSQNPCKFGGDSQTMKIDYRDGGRLAIPPFDVNADGVIDELDEGINGISSGVGLIFGVGVVVDLETGSEFIYSSGSTGNIGVQAGSSPVFSVGRQSWRVLK